MIREIVYEELRAASDVLWKSFYHAEKNNHSMEGLEHFRDLVDPVSLSINTFDGAIVLYGYFEDGELLAVGAVKEKRHVLLLYVLPEYQKKGLGARLLDYMENTCDSSQITVNSSDCGLPFYVSHGFEVCGERTVSEGLISTPMIKFR